MKSSDIIVLLFSFACTCIFWFARKTNVETYSIAIVVILLQCVLCGFFARKILRAVAEEVRSDKHHISSQRSLVRLSIQSVSVLMCLSIPIDYSRVSLDLVQTSGIVEYFRRGIYSQIYGIAILFIGIQLLLWLGAVGIEDSTRGIFSRMLLRSEFGRSIVHFVLSLLSIWSLTYSLLAMTKITRRF